MRASLACSAAFGLMFASFSPAFAASSMYRVTPQAAPGDGRIVVHDIAWSCASGSCVAPRTGKSTDATICSAVARGLGPLASFAAGDNVFDAAAVEKCNHRAR